MEEWKIWYDKARLRNERYDKARLRNERYDKARLRNERYDIIKQDWGMKDMIW